ncbi:MAG TPA: hypothetical protein VFX59_24775 [Polyangiales bacterium]|nr:hypothetical protein [Polyangiales bacterium]
MLVLACGGDDDKGNNDENEPPATGVVLGNGIVGKACAADGDCGAGGSCKKTQGYGALSDILNTFGFDTSLAAPGGYCSIACTNNANCGEGGVCVGAFGAIVMGECRKGCASAADCRDGYECAKRQTTPDGGVVGGTLVDLPAQCQALPPIPSLGPNQVGAACSNAADAGVALNSACGTGTCTLGTCGATCLNDSTCGAGAACVPNGVYGTTGSCQETCAQDTDCNQYTPTGTIGCIDVNGRKLCAVKQYPLAPGVLGTACTADGDCGRGGSCAETIGGGFAGTPAPGGYCTLEGCQDDTVCTGGVCISGAIPLANRCYDTCTVDGECRTGYSCQERPTLNDTTAKVCTPVAAARDAGAAALVVGGLDGGV